MKKENPYRLFLETIQTVTAIALAAYLVLWLERMMHLIVVNL